MVEAFGYVEFENPPLQVPYNQDGTLILQGNKIQQIKRLEFIMAHDLVDNEINLEGTLIPMQGAFDDFEFHKPLLQVPGYHDDRVRKGKIYGIQQRLMLLPI